MRYSPPPPPTAHAKFRTYSYNEIREAIRNCDTYFELLIVATAIKTLYEHYPLRQFRVFAKLIDVRRMVLDSTRAKNIN